MTKGCIVSEGGLHVRLADVQGTELEVCHDIAQRQQHGLKKYGIGVADSPLTLRAWMQHAYEEALDSAVYLKRIIGMLEDIEKRHPPLPFDLTDGEIATHLMNRLSTDKGQAFQELVQLIASMRAVVGVLPRRSTDRS